MLLATCEQDDASENHVYRRREERGCEKEDQGLDDKGAIAVVRGFFGGYHTPGIADDFN